VSTLAIQRWSEPRPGPKNRPTVLAVPAIVVQRDLRSLFVRAYPAVAPNCRNVEDPGIAVVAVDETTGTPAGLAIVRAQIHRHVALVIGRHDRCDLFLDGSPLLALRELVFVLDPVRTFTERASVRYRVLDLRTAHGFADEAGRPLRGLCAEGPAIVRCAGYALFVLPLGDPTDWPSSANDAWDMLPERVYMNETLGHVEHRSMRRRSVLLPIPGPRDSSMTLAADGVVALLELSGGKLAVGAETLRDGLLLGRYLRCDGACFVDDQQLSRVHLLLLQAEDKLLAIDTASTHGVRVGSQPPARVVAVPDRAELRLGGTRLVFTRRAS